MGVDQPEAAAGEVRERGLEVLDGEADVVDALAPLRQELRDRRVLRGGLEQLDPALPHRQERGRDLLRRHVLALALGEAAGAVGVEGRVDRGDGDAEVVDLVGRARHDTRSRGSAPTTVPYSRSAAEYGSSWRPRTDCTASSSPSGARARSSTARRNFSARSERSRV